jgi:hypothetical protein
VQELHCRFGHGKILTSTRATGVRSGTGVVGDMAKRHLHRSIADLQELVVASEAAADQMSDMVATLTAAELQQFQVGHQQQPWATRAEEQRGSASLQAWALGSSGLGKQHRMSTSTAASTCSGVKRAASTGEALQGAHIP